MDSAGALRAVAEAARAAAGADLAVVRVVEDGVLVARAAAGPAFLSAEILGWAAAERPPEDEIDELDALPASARTLAARADAGAVLLLPIPADGGSGGSLELLRAGHAFDVEEREAARLAAAQAGLALRLLAAEQVRESLPAGLELAAEALAVAADGGHTAERVAHLALEVSGAVACLVWTAGEGGLELAASAGTADVERARGAAEGAVGSHSPSETRAGEVDILSLPLGMPVFGLLQLHFRPRPDNLDVGALSAFAGHVARALRAGRRAGAVRRELERTRNLLSVVGQATAQLSLAHTLETVIDRVPELLDLRAAGVYLREGGRLETAASRDVAGPHAAVAARLLDLVLGPFRARGFVASADAADDRHLAPVRAAITETGIEAAHAVPLLAHGEVTGLFAVYPQRGRRLSDDQAALLDALARQLAVAVQNARLHEETKLLGSERERALDAERIAARRLSALYEISRSFAQSLSLESTLDAVARTLVDLLDVDVAVIRLPDERGESLVAQAVHVSSPQLRPSVHAIFDQPDPVVASGVRRRLAEGQAVRLDGLSAGELGRSHRLLVPFLERGSTAAVVPIATPSELLATLTLVSLDPGRPLTDETLGTASTVAAQAALAVDNARLYQQQKAFTDSMQRSLLPRTRPRVPGLEIGAVYESSALVGVGGDVYDYLQIGPDRLAIVLGDVTGHGIDAAADMAMAKFVFRSLARLYPEPGEFLAAANDVVVEEIGAGKFITMLYLTIDVEHGEVACASGGHPPPRLLSPDGTVAGIETGGLVLGIEPGNPYEDVRRPFEPGAAVVLYTDGLIEARRGHEQYGEGRLDEILSAHHELPAEQLAEAVLADCRRLAGGELRDDCAIVVVRQNVNLRAQDRPLRIGHKGAAALEPENTLRSLRRAVELGLRPGRVRRPRPARRDARPRALGRPARGQPRSGGRTGAPADARRRCARSPPSCRLSTRLSSCSAGLEGVGLHVDLKWPGYEEETAGRSAATVSSSGPSSAPATRRAWSGSRSSSPGSRAATPIRSTGAGSRAGGCSRRRPRPRCSGSGGPCPAVFEDSRTGTRIRGDAPPPGRFAFRRRAGARRGRRGPRVDGRRPGCAPADGRRGRRRRDHERSANLRGRRPQPLHC